MATLSASDADGEALTYSLTGNPSGLFKLDGRNVVLKGAADFETLSQHSITVKAKDTSGGEVSKTFDFSVISGVDHLTGAAGQRFPACGEGPVKRLLTMER